MNINDAYHRLKNQLVRAGIEDAGLEADILLRHVCGAGRFELDALTEAQWNGLQNLANHRTGAGGVLPEPLQYILGSWAFLDLELQVGPGVLIPRPETEEVCLAAAAFIEGVKTPAVLDLCAGSGAIALGLQSLSPGATITAVEIDDAAFEWLKRNLAAFSAEHPDEKAPNGRQADALCFYRELPDDSLDLIVSNPPYVTEAEYASLSREVHAEPKRALVPDVRDGGPDDGLLFYRAIAGGYRIKLKPGGHLVFEIGAEQGGAVRSILESAGYADVEIRPDMAGRDRIAIAARN